METTNRNIESYVLESEAIRALNRVEGFDPSKLVRIITDENGNTGYYLDVKWRKLWFRLANPLGAIRVNVLEQNQQYAVVEARIYLHHDDPDSAYISNAIVRRSLDESDPFGRQFMETAETKAIGRALADAGFGIQFPDRDPGADAELADSPFQIPDVTDPIATLPCTVIPESVDTVTGEVKETEIPAPAAAPAVVPAPENPAIPTAPAYTTVSSIEDIYALITLKDAMEYPVPFKNCMGKSLHEVAAEKPSTLQWILESYQGRDNILRAAAKKLLTEASTKI